MKIFKSVIAVIVVIFFYSCQKEISSEFVAPPSETGSNSFRPRKYIEDITSSGQHFSTTYNISYDGLGRVTSLSDSAPTGNKFIYQYSSNSYTMDIYNANVVTIHEVFFLNSLSLVDSSFQYNDTKDSSTEKYIYNEGKQLVMLKQYGYSASSGAVLSNTHNYSYDSSANLIKDADISSVTGYDYFANLTNNLSLGQIYFFNNKNLVKSTSYTAGSETYTALHSYLFDLQNRQTSEKAVISNGDVVIKKYVY